MSNSTVPITVRISVDIKEKLVELVELEHRSMTMEIEYLILKRYEELKKPE